MLYWIIVYCICYIALYSVILHYVILYYCMLLYVKLYYIYIYIMLYHVFKDKIIFYYNYVLQLLYFLYTFIWTWWLIMDHWTSCIVCIYHCKHHIITLYNHYYLCHHFPSAQSYFWVMWENLSNCYDNIITIIAM